MDNETYEDFMSLLDQLQNSLTELNFMIFSKRQETILDSLEEDKEKDS